MNVCRREREGVRVDERKEGLKQKSKGGERECIMMSPTSDTSSCFHGDQGANGMALLRTVLLRADERWLQMLLHVPEWQ